MIRMLALAASAATLFATAAAAQARLPAQVRVENLRAANMSSLEVMDVEGNVIAKLAKPLAAGAKSALKLSRARGCDMTVRASFDDSGEVDETLNLCREKVLRFRD